MDQKPVVTELVIDSDVTGAMNFARAMASAQAASAAATAANDNLIVSMKSANDNARDTADASNRSTLGMRSLAQGTLEAAEGMAKKYAIAVAVVGVLGLLARTLFPLYMAYKVLSEVIHLVTEAWELGNAKLAEYVALAEKARDSGVSTDFFQRINKAAKDAKLPVDELTAALKKLQDATGPQLGGTSAQNRLSELTKAGNFKGNTGIGDLAGAASTEEKLRAVSSLIDQAMQKGERLAALDIAKTFLGDEVAKNLADDAGYLDKMLASADAIKAGELVSQADVLRAQDLQNRLDAAEKILSQRWHPIQDVLTSLGIKMKEVWVGIVESIASAFDWLAKMLVKMQPLLDAYGKLLTIEAKAVATVGWMFGPVGAGAATAATIATAGGDTSSADAERVRAAQMAAAKKRLATLMNQKFDTSHNTETKTEEPDDAVDRAINALRRHTEQQLADAKAVGQGAAAQAQYRAEAALTAAVQANGGHVTAEQARQFAQLTLRAVEAATALAKAKVAADIKFNRDTGFLSQQDVQIAQQLKAIYPDVATALASVEAQGIRVNNAMREFSSSLEQTLTSGLTDIATGAKTASQGFADMALSIVKSLDQMLIKMLVVEPIMRGLQSLLGGFGFGTSLTSGASWSSGLGAGTGGLSFPMFANGTDNAPGGLAMINENGRGEIVDLPNGSRVIPHDVSMRMAAGNDNNGPSVSIGDIYVTVPDGTSPQNAAAIGQAVKASIVQVVDERLSYHTRSRGMLNRAA